MILGSWLGSAKTHPAPHRIPDGTRVYAIGDVHGRADCLEALQEMIVKDAARTRADRLCEIYLGDYIDRGPRSREVIDILLARPPTGHERICLRGNHEAILADCLNDPTAIPHWLKFGGFETLLSYGVAVGLKASEQDYAAIHARLTDAFPDEHRAFLHGLQPMHEIGDYLFVHAGIRPGTALKVQNPEDLLWIREAFLYSSADHGRCIVHGHTPVEEPEVLPNRINIDTGAFLTGRLTCVVLEGTEMRFIQTG